MDREKWFKIIRVLSWFLIGYYAFIMMYYIGNPSELLFKNIIILGIVSLFVLLFEYFLNKRSKEE